MTRILAYFLSILVGAALLTVYRGRTASAENVAHAIIFSLLFAFLVWLRWDVAPKIAKARRERSIDQRQDRG